VVDSTAILMAIGAYLLGGIPFGIVVSRLLGKPDPRTAGSRNVGFTNVLRVSGTPSGLLTLLGDFGKGFLIAWLATTYLAHSLSILAVAFSAVLGHIFSPYLRFQGGKGVATALGVVFGLAPGIGLTLLAIWLNVAVIWRYSSGAAVTAFAALPVVALLAGRDWLFVGFTLVLTALIVQRHGQNLKRLWQGTEPKLGQRMSS
jgi:acyl phosphate:glycerol-3-phosphate acyltransferase